MKDLIIFILATIFFTLCWYLLFCYIEGEFINMFETTLLRGMSLLLLILGGLVTMIVMASIELKKLQKY